MKLQALTKAISIVLVTTMASTTFAANNIAEKTGKKLANAGDSVFSSLTGKQVYGEVNHPVSLYDYNEASSAYEDAVIGGTFTAGAGNQDQANYGLVLNGKYDKVYSSPASNTKINASANANINRAGTKDAETNESFDINLGASYDEYLDPANSKLFWFGAGDLQVIDEKTEDYGGFENPRLDVTGGMGYGRVVNVTPMARAIRIVESLIERGVIKGTPSKAVYQKIAKIASKESEYKSKYGSKEYTQVWVRDIERALGKSVGANGAIKIYEVLTKEKVSTRKYGWDVRAGLGARLLDFNGRNKDVKPLLKAEANYHYPISNRTQFSNQTTFNTVIDDDNSNSTIANDMSLSYELSDRVDWINNWKLTYDINDGSDNVMTNAVSSTYSYEMNDDLYLNTTLTLNHSDADDSKKKVDTGLTTSINYRLK